MIRFVGCFFWLFLPVTSLSLERVGATDIGEKSFPSLLSQMVHTKSTIKHDGAEKDKKQLAQSVALQNSLRDGQGLGGYQQQHAHLPNGPVEGHTKLGHPKSNV